MFGDRRVGDRSEQVRIEPSAAEKRYRARRRPVAKDGAAGSRFRLEPVSQRVDVSIGVVLETADAIRIRHTQRFLCGEDALNRFVGYRRAVHGCHNTVPPYRSNSHAVATRIPTVLSRYISAVSE